MVIHTPCPMVHGICVYHTMAKISYCITMMIKIGELRSTQNMFGRNIGGMVSIAGEGLKF